MEVKDNKRVLIIAITIKDSIQVMLKSKVNIKVNLNKVSMENVYQDTNEKQAIVVVFNFMKDLFQPRNFTVVVIDYQCDTS